MAERLEIRSEVSCSRSWLTYVCILVVGLLAIGTSLHIGEDIETTPAFPALSAVTGGAEACLGARVSSLQSGEFVDLYVPGPPGAEALEDQLGSRLGRARVNRSSNAGKFEGSCARGVALAGTSYVADVHVAKSGKQVTVSGTLTTTGNEPVALSLAAADGVASSTKWKPLSPSAVVARTFLAVAIVLLACRALGYALARVRQPRVIGEIVAGILLGPSLLGAFFPTATAYLFPSEVLSVIRVMAQFGLVFFMFLIGLELDVRHVRQVGHLAVLVSHVSIVLPFVMGTLLALALYPILGAGSYAGFALFMGAAMAITAFPVLARILTDTGLNRTPVGALAITCAAVDDFTAWCVLAVVVSIAKASGVMDAAVTTTLAIAFVAFMLLVVRPILRPFATLYVNRSDQRKPIMAGVICGLLLAAWVTEMIGIHAIFGAFIFGVTMPRGLDLCEAVAERLEDVTVLCLLPIFFAVVGLSTRFGLLDHWLHWAVAAVVIAVAIAGKYAGSTLAARRMGVQWRDASALGLLMNARGLTELVFLTVGRSLGVISPALFAIMVLMALVTTFMATPLLVRFYLPHVPDLGSDVEATLSGRRDAA